MEWDGAAAQHTSLDDGRGFDLYMTGSVSLKDSGSCYLSTLSCGLSEAVAINIELQRGQVEACVSDLE